MGLNLATSLADVSPVTRPGEESALLMRRLSLNFRLAPLGDGAVERVSEKLIDCIGWRRRFLRDYNPFGYVG
jgi:hypothetical protein